MYILCFRDMIAKQRFVVKFFAAQNSFFRNAYIRMWHCYLPRIYTYHMYMCNTCCLQTFINVCFPKEFL